MAEVKFTSPYQGQLWVGLVTAALKGGASAEDAAVTADHLFQEYQNRWSKESKRG